MIKRFQRHCFGRLKLLDAMWWNAPYPVSIIRPLHHFVMVVEHASRRRLCPTVTIDKCHPAGLFVCQFVWHLACRFLCFFLVFPCTSLFGVELSTPTRPRTCFIILRNIRQQLGDSVSASDADSQFALENWVEIYALAAVAPHQVAKQLRTFFIARLRLPCRQDRFMGESFWAMHFRLISKLYLGLIYGETHSKSPQKYISQAQKLLDPFCMLVFKCVTSSTSGTLATWKFRRYLRLFKDIIYIYLAYSDDHRW